MGESVQVGFSSRTMYFDKEYSGLFLNVIGNAELSSDGLPVTEDSAKSIIQKAINSTLGTIGSKGVSYKDLMSETQAITEGVSDLLKGFGFNLVSFQINSILPDEESQNFIQSKELNQQVQNMTPEEINKKMQEAMAQARAADPVTAAALDNIAAQQPAFQQQAATPQVEPNYPKFCPNCGTPTIGKNFCGE